METVWELKAEHILCTHVIEKTGLERTNQMDDVYMFL